MSEVSPGRRWFGAAVAIIGCSVSSLLAYWSWVLRNEPFGDSSPRLLTASLVLAALGFATSGVLFMRRTVSPKAKRISTVVTGMSLVAVVGSYAAASLLAK
ncbi:MAG: hypothetical protein QOE83_162 [Actinomycetota bacterium]|jgi:hypothetical protein|nr:hypothetical protein [Actinomycetota bacterium]